MSLVYQVSLDDPHGDSSTRRQRRCGLYIGDKNDAKNYEKLTNYWHVTHIVNVTTTKQSQHIGGVPNYFEKESTKKLTYLRIPVYDSEMSAYDLHHKYADQIVNFISSGLHHGSVLVHCHRGISRSPTAVLFYMMSFFSFSFLFSLSY